MGHEGQLDNLLSMIVVDTWLVYSQATGSTELQPEFVFVLQKNRLTTTSTADQNVRETVVRMGVTAMMNLL